LPRLATGGAAAGSLPAAPRGRDGPLVLLCRPMAARSRSSRCARAALVAMLCMVRPGAAAHAQDAALPEDLRPWQVKRPRDVARTSLELRLVVDRRGPGTVELPGPEGKPLILASTIVLTRDDVTKVEVGPSIDLLERWKQHLPPHYAIYLHFTPEAA